jgi:S-adenosylmethionine:tRNA ribosyltransferase-isomerase
MKMNIDETGYNLSNYIYSVPPSLIAQEPLFPRDTSRLLIVDRVNKIISETIFRDIANFLKKGDILVLNNTRVIKARLLGRRESGGKVDILLVREKEKGLWEVLLRPAKRIKIGETIIFKEGRIAAKVLAKKPSGERILQFFPQDIRLFLDIIGKPPLPHYIKKEIDNFQKYQTIYAYKDGAIAAPTAGFHFTEEVLRQISDKGVKIVSITLHCGLATFRPVKTNDIREHKIQSEWIEVSLPVAEAVNVAKKQGSRVIAVGTTSVRALESVAVNTQETPSIKGFCGQTSLYITPGYKFKIVDSVITNFHTPCSTNLILMASFCGIPLLRQAYDYAIKQKFRFFSFGDAMIVV